MLGSYTSFLSIDVINCILEPVQNVGGLYLGNIYAAFDDALLAQYNIGAVLTVAAHSDLTYKDKKHLIIAVEDMEQENLSKYFDQMIEFIEQNIANTNVLVHCFAGVSRSSSAVIVYLMHKNSWDYNKAYLYVKGKRPIVYPNAGFQRQLRAYDKNKKPQTIKSLEQPKIQPRSFSNVGKNLDQASLKGRLYNVGPSYASKKPKINSNTDGLQLQNPNSILPCINGKRPQAHQGKPETSQQAKQPVSSYIFNGLANAENSSTTAKLQPPTQKVKDAENHKEEGSKDKKSRKKIPQMKVLNQKLSDLQLDGKNLKINSKDTMKAMYKNLKKY